MDKVEVSGECRRRHTVKAGDTCSALSSRFNVAAHALQAHNGLDWKCNLQVGQELCVSKNECPVCTTPHSVVPGDDCHELAKSHGVNLLDLETWNPDLINDRCAIRPGHTVCVKADEPVQSPATVLLQ